MAKEGGKKGGQMGRKVGRGVQGRGGMKEVEEEKEQVSYGGHY